MTYSFDGNNYTLRFEKGELFVDSLLHFVKEQELKGGWIMGLGGLSWAELGFYDLNAREYQWRRLNMALELTSLEGNIAWQDGKPVLHLHANVSDASLQVYGGHLKAAEVGGTVEVFVYRWLTDEGLSRSLDEETGLNLLQL